MLAKGKNSGVTLSRPVPVHLTYFTAWSTAVGKLQTFADVYGLDKKMAAALFGKSEALVGETARRQTAEAQRAGTAGGCRLDVRPVRQLADSRYCAGAASAFSIAARIARASSLSDGSRAPITSTRSPGRASSATRATSQSRDGANSARGAARAISATMSAAEKSRVAVPPA